jgi:DNA polymerase-1
MTNHAKKADAFLRRNGFMTTVLGRRRYIPTNKRQYAQAVNTPVQGSGADMFKLAFKKVHEYLTAEVKCGKINSNTRVWFVMHDELVIQVHKDEIDVVVPVVKRLMEEAGQELCGSVRHIAEFKIGAVWDK